MGDAYQTIDYDKKEDCDCEEEGYCTPQQAEQWSKYGNKIINDDNGKPYKIEHPDWHSHSWLTTEEFKSAMDIYDNHDEGGKYPEPEYKAILAAMIELEKHDYECRIVFWFDN